MSRVRFVRLFSVLALAFWASTLSASTITYAVGTCRPHLPSYPTISAALAATPPANVVEVCPGTYKEQVQITQPVTLEGVSNGTSAEAVFAPPAGGLVANATDDFGNPVAAQLWVNNASGPVNISDLTVDASGNGVSGFVSVIGIFYQNSSGTVNRVATRNQSTNGFGIGILAQGDSSIPFINIENSSVHDYDQAGILLENNGLGIAAVIARISENEIATSHLNADAIDIFFGGQATIRSNLIVNGGTQPHPGNYGILADWGPDTISGNTVVGGNTGIFISDALSFNASVTSNKIFGSNTGISLSTFALATIQSNSITKSRIGIEFQCNFSPNVHSNIVTESGTALDSVPSAISTSGNTYFNVGTIRAGGC